MLATAKIHILKQFTTVFMSILRRINCACHCKDTHFEAIHNFGGLGERAVDIVLATAKIHILKQFTTRCSKLLFLRLLCLPLQRYTFWSNSQLNPSEHFRFQDCACHCKDTHFEAIHNFGQSVLDPDTIVLATAKIHILKQFTTKSRSVLLPVNCACHCKDTHFEAIHNNLHGEVYG